MLNQWLNDLAQEEHEKTASAQFEEVLRDMDIPELRAFLEIGKEKTAQDPEMEAAARRGGAIGAGVPGAVLGGAGGAMLGGAVGGRKGALIGGLGGAALSGLGGAAGGALAGHMRARGIGGDLAHQAVGGFGGVVGSDIAMQRMKARRAAEAQAQGDQLVAKEAQAMFAAADAAGRALAKMAAEGQELPKGFAQRPEAIVRTSPWRDAETPVDPELAAQEAAVRHRLMRPADTIGGALAGGVAGGVSGFEVAGVPGAVLGGVGGATLGGGAGYGLNRLMEGPAKRQALLQALGDRDKLEAAQARTGEEIPEGFANRPGGVVRESPWRGMPTPVDPQQARDEQLRIMRSARPVATGVMGAAGALGGAAIGGSVGGVRGAILGGLGGAALGAGGIYGLSRGMEGPAGREAEAQALKDRAKLEQMQAAQAKTASFRGTIEQMAAEGRLRTFGG